MTNKRGRKSKNKGSNLQSNSRVIEKRIMNGNMQRVPAAPSHGYTPAYSNVQHGPVQGESAPTDHGPGYIFMCNGKTKADCYKYRVFGLPSARMDILEKIKPHTKLFLFDFDLKLLYGVYIAASAGNLAIEPAAFGGRFSAQVRFEILRDCLPLPESAFKPAIADNYSSGTKFRQELSNKQVADLISLFCPIAEPPPGFDGSLMPTTVHSATVIPRSIEMHPQMAPELSNRYDQYLARSYHANREAAGDFRHVQSGPSLPHAPCTFSDRDYLHPPLVSQSQIGAFKSAEAYQTRLHESPVLHSRYTGMADDTERMIVQRLGPTNNYYKEDRVRGDSIDPSTSMHGQELRSLSSRTAAYWVQVAANPDQIYSSSPTSSGLGGQSIVSASHAIVAQTSPVVQDIKDTGTVQSSSASGAVVTQARPVPHEIKDTGTVQSSTDVNGYNHLVHVATNVHASTEPMMQQHYEAPSQGPAYMHSSYSGGVYSVAPASQDPAYMHTGPDQGLQPVGTTTLGATYLSETVPAATLGHAYGYNPDISVPSASIQVQAHGQLPSQLPIQLHGSAHPLSASASYWAGVAYEDPGQVYQYPHTQPIENNVSYNTGVTYHDPNQAYQYPHLMTSGNTALYQTAGVFYQDPSQAYQYPHHLSSGNGVSYQTAVAYEDPSLAYHYPYQPTSGTIYIHNLVTGDPSLQVQAYEPSYIAAAPQVPPA